MKRRKQGFTLVETAITVAVVGLLASIAIPSFSAARNRSLNNAKKANVRLLNNAIQQWAMDTFQSDEALISPTITNYLKNGLSTLNVGGNPVNITNITTKTIGHTFTIEELY